ncbi:hypothetical protein JCM17843_12930 [Kordiimonadales bacterium JCM 17843]|nr:hypothetical protein JCM17843_12930 [Kordiimonadales bacterium JCM 17843]
MMAPIIDFIILLFISLLIGLVFGVVLSILGSEQEAIELYSNIVGGVVGWLYFALMESSEKQATLGKAAIGIKVTDMNGQRISFLRAIGRHFGKILSTIILMIDYVVILFTKRKQGLHDMIAGCLVLKERK